MLNVLLDFSDGTYMGEVLFLGAWGLTSRCVG